MACKMQDQAGGLDARLAAAVDAACPADSWSAHVRVQRATALALLHHPGHRNTSSLLADAVQKALRSNIKNLGCSASFRQILQQAPQVFTFAAGPSPHEACIVLNEQGLLQCLGQPRQQQQPAPPPRMVTSSNTSSSSAILSPTAARGSASAPWQQSGSFAAVAAARPAAHGRVYKLTGPGMRSPAAPAADGGGAVAAAAGWSPAASSQQTSQQQQQGQSIAVMSPQAAAGSSSSSSVSSARLFEFVSTRLWHADNLQLNTARQALAVSLVKQANPVLSSSSAANTDAGAYITTSPLAGQVMLAALKARFEARVQRCYSKISQALAGDPFLTPFMSGPSQQSVRLDIHALLQQAVAGSQQQQQQQPALAASAVQSPQAAARTLSASSFGSCAAGVAAPSAAAAGNRAAVSAAADTVSGLERATSSSAAAQAAADALKAAAQSLMPPLSCTSPAAGAQQGTAAGSAHSTHVHASANAHQQPAVPVSKSPPGFPPWLHVAAAPAGPADEQQQQQQPLDISSWVLADEQPTPHLGSQQGQQQAAPAPASVQAEYWAELAWHSDGSVDSSRSDILQAASAAEAADDEPASLQLQYRLVLRNDPSGWYTAEYVPTIDSAQPQQASSTSRLHPAEGAGTAAAAAGSDVPVELRRSSGGGGSSSGPTAGKPAAEVQSHNQAGSQQQAADGMDADTSAFPQLFPARLGGALEPYLSTQLGTQPLLTQVLVDSGQPVTLRFSDLTSVQLHDTDTTLSNALQHLLVLQQRWGSVPLPPAAAVGDQRSPDPGAVPGTTLAANKAAADSRVLEQQNSIASSSSNSSSSPSSNSSTSSSGSPVSGVSASAGPEAGMSPAAMTDNIADTRPAAAAATPTLTKPSPAQPSPAATATICNLTLHGAAVQQAAEQGSAAAGAAPAAPLSDALFEAGAVFSADGCLGVPGSCHRVCAVQDAAGRVAGLTYCLQRAAPGAAASLADVLSGMKASLMVEAGLDRPCSGARSLLVLGRPGSPKTCLLRDMCRLMSSSHSQGGLGLHVMLLDTTGRIAGLHTQPTPHIGATRCLPVPSRQQQSQLMLQAALNHSPDVLVVGEVSTEQEVAAAVRICRSCNVLLVAAAPAPSLSMLLQDSTLCQLLGFELGTTGTSMGLGVYCTAGPNLSLHRVRHTPFSAAVEVLGSDSWCVHTDLHSSSDEAAGQLSSCGTDSGPAPGGLNTHAQQRSRGAGGDVLVQAGSASAVHRALLYAALPPPAAAIAGGAAGLCL